MDAPIEPEPPNAAVLDRLHRWADLPLAADHLSGFAGPWKFTIRRWLRKQSVLDFPAPATVTQPDEALIWERRGRAIAAQHSTRGQFAMWLLSGSVGALLGLLIGGWASATRSSSAWPTVVGAAIAWAIGVALVIGILVLVAGPTLASLHVHAPTWEARAEAYARRREELLKPDPDETADASHQGLAASLAKMFRST
ncbi:hypothetical protein OMK64_03605 [Cellulomonas fimi]|uniref:hypothetical protein n=1 Tax=Cellulomonas fimi TaxID=1708 RepID=UPI00234D9322|nr:hypothetical protein [Cellulomonas fimi]MDC7120617.1 hypothetical protein [Cellulomonas fimi]